ncbi:MAG: KEOPS complex subunit Pcc1 [Methanobrevibacter sp.]|uniref:KEOPS complex subunit Pcc1 n=1 Tax=Methanobrevibacter sp. TaxID=66852 RepID=UPI0026DF9F85|nr:KEOPS complex subunit Pcc1 [Methanobrevibacter sp.]MDO5849377.1 KEOPS complex subunit Pcc1 [Methanobrevibacter sp.]
MLESTPLEEINNKIAIEFDNENQARIVYDSIILELKTAPDYRSSIEMDIEDNTILIKIDAQDATSFRASFNSVIKWIKLSLDIHNLTV